MPWGVCDIHELKDAAISRKQLLSLIEEKLDALYAFEPHVWERRLVIEVPTQPLPKEG